MSPSYLVLGSGGMLGRAFAEQLALEGAEYLALDRTALDLREPDQIKRLPKGEVVVCCAAYTNVDRAETDESEARAVNSVAVAQLAEICKTQGRKLLHFSTDYVFDGEASTPYSVDAPYGPLGVYGRTKMEGELALRESGAEYLLVRTSWVHAPWGKNFVLTMRTLLESQPLVRVVSDQVGRPTQARNLAKNSLSLLRTGARGTYHITDAGSTSWFGLASYIRDRIGSRCEVEPTSSADFPRPAKRPSYSVLDLDASSALLGDLPDFRSGVDESLGVSP